MSTGATPYSLAFGTEAVLPVEIEFPAMRLASANFLPSDSAAYAEAQLADLDALDEERIRALQHLQIYRQRMARAYDKKVLPRPFLEGYLVLRQVTKLRAGQPMTKFEPNWEGPYIIHKVYGNGCYELADLNEEAIPVPKNGKFLKLWYGGAK
uniref:Uncharacterized protein n=1 Tax=Nelumbo nucifera TaxID=4432 RepID=A0A822Y2J5_NELNU|nr:TPA_asm: hypothetical protein HUJ06_026993 [Nelumbo nucifera]DAD25593.1 TPA_asm: hypothetical protein HUJ06_027057 [Nelumbo nucifera]